VAEALALFKADDYDLCIMDGRLSDGSGADLCRRMLEIKPDFPVIFISGLTRESDIAEARNAGAKEYLIKPCDTEELQKIVKELIGN
jgi:two-component system, OmpR family, response regulator